MSSTILLPPRAQLCNSYCSNKQQWVMGDLMSAPRVCGVHIQSFRSQYRILAHRRCLFLFRFIAILHLGTIRSAEDYGTLDPSFTGLHTLHPSFTGTPMRLLLGAVVRSCQSSAPFPLAMRPNGTRVFLLQTTIRQNESFSLGRLRV